MVNLSFPVSSCHVRKRADTAGPLGYSAHGKSDCVDGALMPNRMTEAQRLRAQSERCLRLAREPIAPDMAESLHKLGLDYLAQANAVERSSGQQQQRGNQPPPP